MQCCACKFIHDLQHLLYTRQGLCGVNDQFVNQNQLGSLKILPAGTKNNNNCYVGGIGQAC